MQAILHSKAPVIWSHPLARAVHKVPRNVPDEALGLINIGDSQKDGITMVYHFGYALIILTFIDRPCTRFCCAGCIQIVADHIGRIAKISGKKQSVSRHNFWCHRRTNYLPGVGISSDFGMSSAPRGLEDFFSQSICPRQFFPL